MTCAFAVRGALKKFPGVESVDVSLNKGLATVKLKPANAVTPEQFWEAVKNNGFTPKDTHVVVRGEVFSVGGKLQMKVNPTNRVYELTGVKPVEGKVVTAEGTMTPAKDLKASVPIRVQSAR
jgi:copper chaperone CopZ